MSSEIKTPKPPATQAPAASEDLSAAIEKTVEKQSDEEVKTVRVFDDLYRCNWWVREKPATWLSHTTGTIRKSRFFRVRRTGDQLVIEDLSNRR